MSNYELFDPIDIRKFYRNMKRGLSEALREAIRWEDGWEAQIDDHEGCVVFRFRLPGQEWHEYRLTDIPRAWEWWTPPPRRRGYTILWMSEDGLVLEEGPSLTDREVWCDLCGAEILFRPVPLFMGSHALCSECLRGVTSITLEQAAQMDRVDLQWLDPEWIEP